MIRKLAVSDQLAVPHFSLPIVLALGPEHVTYYRTSKRSSAKVDTQLLTANCRIIDDSFAGFGEHRAVLGDQRRFKMGLLRKEMRPRQLKILYTHGTDAVPCPPPNAIMLYSSERQFFEGMKKQNRLLLGESGGGIDWGITDSGGEGALGGLVHLHDVAQTKCVDKKSLQDRVARAMGVSFNPSLPLLVYYVPETLRHQEVDESLRALSEHATIVVKTFGSRLQSLATGDNIFFWPERNFSSSLLRLAADVLLCGYESGTLITSLMMGLPVIPVYTPLVDAFGRAGFDLLPEEKVKFAQLPHRWKEYTAVGGKMSALVGRLLPPVNITDTNLILDRIRDAAYWQNYATSLPALRRRLFGRCPLDDAPARAAKYIKNALRHGTALVPETARLGRRLDVTDFDSLIAAQFPEKGEPA